MSMSEETWRDAPGYDGLYMVSDLGNVASLGGRKGSEPFKVLRQSYMGSGYRKVTLRKNGAHVNASVHRMVAMAFVPNPENKPFVNHIDGNKENNAASNLEWVNRSENAMHASRVLGRHGGGVCRSVKITESEAVEIFKSDEPASAIARKYGISDTMVRRIKQRKAWREATCQLTA